MFQKGLVYFGKRKKMLVTSIFSFPAIIYCYLQMLSIWTGLKFCPLVKSFIFIKITENVWVQCDNPNCQKWRKVPKEAAVSYGPGVPWYCSLNQDSNANDCSKPEENHAEYEKMAVKAGVKFVLSELEMGELVWAKTAGYCRY